MTENQEKEKRRTRWAFYSLSIICVIVAVFFTIPLLMPAKPVELLIYTSNSAIEKMLAATLPPFTAKTGIKVKYIVPGASGAVVNKVVAEKGAPSADICIASLPSMLQAKTENALEKYVSTESANYPDVFKDKDGYFCGWYAFHTVIAYNPKYVTDPPKTFNDLLDPAYKGRIAYPDPTTSGNGLRFMCALIEVMGEEEAFNFMAELEPSVARHDSLALGEFLDKGEMWIQVSDDAAVTTDVLTKGLKDQYIDITNEGQIAGYVAVAITKGAPHLVEAKRLVDFMLSVEGQGYVTAGYGYPCRSNMDAAIPENLRKIWEPLQGKPVIPLDWAEISSKMAGWKQRWLEQIQPI